MRIAIVGTGVSGLVCAHLLHPRHDVTVFEADDRIGGHVNTVRVDLADETHQVDTGFIVHNRQTYPNFVRLLEELGVQTQASEMSFSVSDPATGLEYRGTNINTVFAQRRNAARPSFLRLLADIGRFNRSLRRSLLAEALDDDLTIDDFIEAGSYSSALRRYFVEPLGASIWSADPATFGVFPAASYAHFMENHGLLRPKDMVEWRTITGGSDRYVEALIAPFVDQIRVATPVTKIVRHEQPGEDSHVEIVTPAHGPETFDAVVLATHSDQALRLLGDPSSRERDILGSLRYQANKAILHTDEQFLPRAARARAAWNFHVSDSRQATLTYWMNRLQSIESRHQLLLTLNRDDIAPERVLASFEYHHPVFDREAVVAQRRRDEIQGNRATYFAGAYWGYGFHEDGVRSAIDVVSHLEGHA